MSKLTEFLSYRIAEEEVRHHKAIASGATGWARLMADKWLSECDTKRWTLKFHERVSHSAEPGSAMAWATLTPVLLKMAAQWKDHPDYDPAWATPDEPESFADRMARKSMEALRAKYPAADKAVMYGVDVATLHPGSRVDNHGRTGTVTYVDTQNVDQETGFPVILVNWDDDH